MPGRANASTIMYIYSLSLKIESTLPRQQRIAIAETIHRLALNPRACRSSVSIVYLFYYVHHRVVVNLAARDVYRSFKGACSRMQLDARRESDVVSH